MKRFILFITATLILVANTLYLYPFPAKANAEEEFLRVITDETPFYSDEELNDFLFYLPYTYYVRTLSENAGVVHAEIEVSGAIIDGYVEKNLLYYDGLSVENPYPKVLLETSKNAVLYEDASLTSPTLYAFAGRTMKFLGRATFGNETIYYVSYNNHIGYVKESDVMPFSIENHPNPLTFIKTPEKPEENSDKKPQSESNAVFILRIVIIGALSLAGVVGLIVSLIKKPKDKPPFYEESESE